MSLQWPLETVLPESGRPFFSEPGSNRVLDFHGDPCKAGLAVFSDGNHHMALLPALKAFHADNPAVEDIFYATTPPGPIAALLENGALTLGNLTLSVRPHLFISPPHVLDGLQAKGFVASHELLACNYGSVLLVPHGNPKRIGQVADLMRGDVRLFISNPDTETVSHEGYRQTLEGMARAAGVDCDAFSAAVLDATAVFGQRIHHREAPETLAAGRADAAIVYYHLALRYTRIFPHAFDIVPLGGTRDRPRPHPCNRTASVHMGLVGDGGPWGARLLAFLRSRAAGRLYAEHGLRHVAMADDG